MKITVGMPGAEKAKVILNGVELEYVRWVRHKRFDAAITEQEGEAWPNEIQSLKR